MFVVPWRLLGPSAQQPPLRPDRASRGKFRRGTPVKVAATIALAGSFPRTRGTPPEGRCRGPLARFIPAHAGNTSTGNSTDNVLTVHPRARGEHHPQAGPEAPQGGSSPRTRGTRCRHGAGRGMGRFIPAHAGNTPRSPSASSPLTVHPRARGEHILPVAVVPTGNGSSPRTRGTRGFRIQRVHIERFIPAHAGNTFRMEPGRVRLPVHPRARGEHAMPQGQLRHQLGSSPRTRGTHPACVAARRRERFIPAHAGNTEAPSS